MPAWLPTMPIRPARSRCGPGRPPICAEDASTRTRCWSSSSRRWQTKASGFGLTRLWANMEWALEKLPGVEDLLEYETRLNRILPQYDDFVVCTYDLSKFSASVVVDVLRTHPWAVVGRTLQQNPFYIPPDQMLREMRDRG
ncbi:MAG: hypothetical protein DI563_02440 [Variovorax paradoxus]|uniref:MEDS domain-containing protein n=1 Tax=Variovorax paradoxus TaxID=34073 RepID=A0A2W5QKN1_VARPD|nr:MAG: hypothetical protein DI563_02440 [Variovorax paradoxus]